VTRVVPDQQVPLEPLLNRDMATKPNLSQMSSRRATQLCIQRFMTPSTDKTPTLPSMCYGIGPCKTSTLKLPNLISHMTATGATSPSCLHCDARMSWVDWYQDSNAFNIGPGKFCARCALCQANDASFKDGPPPR